MINNLHIYLTSENIYLIANWGVIPFWLLLIFAPQHTITKIFSHSIIAPLILAIAYTHLVYQIYLEDNIFEIFDLYFGLDNLYAIYSNENFLLIFWLHFLSLSLFIGAWISRDGLRCFIPRFIIIFSLIITYFAGPVGLVIYWIFRIFFAKKINFDE